LVIFRGRFLNFGGRFLGEPLFLLGQLLFWSISGASSLISGASSLESRSSCLGSCSFSYFGGYDGLGYDETEERYRQREAARRGATEYPTWKAMIRRLGPPCTRQGAGRSHAQLCGLPGASIAFGARFVSGVIPRRAYRVAQKRGVSRCFDAWYNSERPTIGAKWSRPMD
jgi:hypothetical protein